MKRQWGVMRFFKQDTAAADRSVDPTARRNLTFEQWDEQRREAAIRIAKLTKDERQKIMDAEMERAQRAVAEAQAIQHQGMQRSARSSCRSTGGSRNSAAQSARGGKY
jgi:hypothetical protein